MLSAPFGRSSPRLPRWVPVVGVLLVVNVLVIGYALLGQQAAAPPPPGAAAGGNAAAAKPTSLAPGAASAVSRGAIPEAAPVSGAAGSAPAAPPIAPVAPPSARPAPRASAPVTGAAEAPTPPSAAAVATRDDLLARGSSVPPAELNMHVYDPNPLSRFVLLNGQRLREGEASREGLTVERITPEGVVLRFGNAAFALTLQ